MDDVSIYRHAGEHKLTFARYPSTLLYIINTLLLTNSKAGHDPKLFETHVNEANVDFGLGPFVCALLKDLSILVLLPASRNILGF